MNMLLLYNTLNDDVISVKEKSRQMPMVLLALESAERDIPEYITVNTNKMEGVFLHAPKFSDIPYPVQMEPNLVIEFYSR